MNFNQGDKQKPKRNLADEARRFRLTQNLRALLLVLPVVAFAVLLSALFLIGPSKPDAELNNWNRTPALSGVHDTKQLMAVLQASRAAYNEYIRRDQVAMRLDHVTRLFGKVRSEADLAWALQELARVSGDKYTEVLSHNQYRDRMARMQGQTIGVDLEFSVQPGTQRTIIISRCPPESHAFERGLREGDEVVSFDELHIDQMALGQPWQTAQRLKQIADTGLLGSTIKIVVKRDDVFYEAEVRRVVLWTPQSQPTLQENGLWGQSGQIDDGRQINIESLWNPETLPQLTELLKRYEKEKVKGILLNLGKVNGCEGDTAIRVAALFLEKGVVTHKILVQQDGTLLMQTYEAVDGKVRLTTKGPFAVNADGQLDGKAKAEPKVEMLDWESNVFKGHVVAILSDETSGGGEVIAAALMQNLSKHVVTSMYLTAGKGTYQSYFNVGPEHWISVSTAFFLRPDGRSIEVGVDGKGGRIFPNAVPRGVQNEWQFNQFAVGLLEERLRVIPAPDLPPEPAKEPVKK